MPCERKLIEAIEAEWRKLLVDGKASHSLPGAIFEALAACDQSLCVWTVTDDGRAVPGCIEDDGLFRWDNVEMGWMNFCPHCGRKIAPLPEAPRKDET